MSFFGLILVLFMYMSLSLAKEGLRHLFYSLPNDKILGCSKLKAFADNKINETKKLKFVLQRVENIVKRRKSWLPAFSPFTRCFQKASFSRLLKAGHDWERVDALNQIFMYFMD